MACSSREPVERLRLVLVLVLWALMTPGTTPAQGKKITCACSTLDCRGTGVNTCSTKYKCYTQYLDRKDGYNPLSYGCMTVSKPILCEIRLPAVANRSQLFVLCCNDRDLCNKDNLPDPPPWALEIKPQPSSSNTTSSPCVATRSPMEEDKWAAIQRTASFFYTLNQPVMVAVLFVGMFLIIAIMGFGFYLLYQQSVYMRQPTKRRIFLAKKDEVSSSFTNTSPALTILDISGPSTTDLEASKC